MSLSVDRSIGMEEAKTRIAFKGATAIAVLFTINGWIHMYTYVYIYISCIIYIYILSIFIEMYVCIYIYVDTYIYFFKNGTTVS